MSDDRRQILDMLSEGKITAEEAERLLSALESSAGPVAGSGEITSKGSPKYIRVLVDAVDPKHGPTKVNIRVPMQLLRAGVRLTGLMPDVARQQVNEAMQAQGITFDVNQLRPENLEELVSQLNELTIDVDNPDAKVRVFCE